MLRTAAGILVCLALSACRYESTTDFRSAAQQYSPTGAFPAGKYLFLSEDERELLTVTVAADRATILHQTGSSSPLSATILTVLGSDQLPNATYLAFAAGAKSEKGQKFHYYPFTFNESRISWLRPDTEIAVSSFGQLARQVSEGFRAQRARSFHLVPRMQEAGVADHFAALRSRSSSGTAARPQPAPLSPPVAAKPTVKGFSVGDGVYVQGFFSDSPSIIQEIDQANRRVKVFRYQDGVSDWVGFDAIISRNESTANDVGRAGLAIGAMVCVFSPETCKPQPK